MIIEIVNNFNEFTKLAYDAPIGEDILKLLSI